MTTKAILIDISETLITKSTGQAYPGVGAMLLRLHELTGNLFFVSNQKWSLRSNDARLPIPPESVLSRVTVGKPKGSGNFVSHVRNKLGLKAHEIVYIGDGRYDMYEASNSGVLFLRADWSTDPDKATYGMPFASPADLQDAIENWIFKEFPWYFSMDGSDLLVRRYAYRSLMDNQTSTKYGVRDLLKIGASRGKIADQLAGELIGSVNGEGLLEKDFMNRDPIVTVYPGSRGQQNRVLDRLVKYTSNLVGLKSLPDLIVRHTIAQKSAYLRNDSKPVFFTEQMNTIHLNPSHAKHVTGRSVVVFDDFTTDGKSLEAARNYLLNAGAAKVICVSAGKYKRTSEIYSPSSLTPWDSYAPNRFNEDDFNHTIVDGVFEPRATRGFNT